MKLNTPLKGLIIFVTLLLPLIAARLGRVFANQFNYEWIDPDGAFAWMFVRHTVQAIIILVIIIVMIKLTKLKFGFTLGDKKTGIEFIKKFTLYFFIYNVVLYAILSLTNQLQALSFPLNARNITGYLSFQLLMSGPSEEILFRAFIMTIVGVFISKRVMNDRFSIANILAALSFVVAHIAFTFSPFSYSFNIIQLGYSLVLGIIYGICYEKSKSVYYPMALHSISNIITVSMAMIAQSLFL